MQNLLFMTGERNFMKLLEDRIIRDGKIFEGNVLKVDSFVNHQIDVAFISELGKEFKRLYEGCEINKILTIEASGIGIACLVAMHFNVPVVFAKDDRTAGLFVGHRFSLLSQAARARG